MQDDRWFTPGDDVIVDNKGHWLHGCTGTIVSRTYDKYYIVKLDSEYLLDGHVDVEVSSVRLRNSYKIASVLDNKERCDQHAR